MKRFALIGAAGYIAPRHMQAIKDTGHELVAALDKSDSVGVIDRYFPDARFFVEFERFDRHIDKVRRRNDGQKVDFVSICSPNYLHDAHVRFALRSEADAICEKPLVLNPWNLDGLQQMEGDTGRRINCILQLRLHPAVAALEARVSAERSNTKHDVDLTYITPRGNWYSASWKGDDRRSGGIATNIGVHFYDMLHFVFGRRQTSHVHYRTPSRAAGYLEYERARVRWFLSVKAEDVPCPALGPHPEAYRSIVIDGEEVEFSSGFSDLHTESYRAIVAGRGFGVEDSRAAIETIEAIRNDPVDGKYGERHPLLEALIHQSLAS